MDKKEAYLWMAEKFEDPHTWTRGICFEISRLGTTLREKATLWEEMDEITRFEHSIQGDIDYIMRKFNIDGCYIWPLSCRMERTKLCRLLATGPSNEELEAFFVEYPPRPFFPGE